MRVLKLFISQPTCGLTDKEILDKRCEVIAKLTEEYGEDCFFSLLNPVCKNLHTTESRKHLSCVISMLGEADIVYFVKGWETHASCIIEHVYADTYGLIVLEEI